MKSQIGPAHSGLLFGPARGRRSVCSWLQMRVIKLKFLEPGTWMNGPCRNCSIVGGGAYSKEQVPLGHCECRVQNLIFQEKLKFQILCSVYILLILGLKCCKNFIQALYYKLSGPESERRPAVRDPYDQLCFQLRPAVTHTLGLVRTLR